MAADDFHLDNMKDIFVKFGSKEFYFRTFDGDFQTKVLENGKIWERHIFQYMLEKKNINRPTFDIGANIGFHSIMQQKFTESQNLMIAVEPHYKIADILRHNVEKNNVSVEIIRKAVGKDCKGLKISSPKGDSGDTHIGSEGKKVEAIRIDDLTSKYGQPKIVKIDIQGFEADALIGAENTIKNGDVHFLIEFSPKLLHRSSEHIFDALEILEYQKYGVFFFRAHPFYAAEPLSYEILKSIYNFWHKYSVGSLELLFRQRPQLGNFS